MPMLFRNKAGEDNIVSLPSQICIVGTKFDWVMSISSSWIVGGLFVDGWAHAHIIKFETFFTPWHAVFYSGFLTAAGVLLMKTRKNHTQRRSSWVSAIPPGYELSLLGVGLFGLGGIGDMIWHLLFGIEVDVEALLSPTHLLLACGLVLLITGPFRAAWNCPPARTSSTWKSLFPMLLSLTLFFSVITFFTEFSHPFVNTLPVFVSSRVTRYGWLAMKNFGIALGITGIELHTILIMGLIFLLVRRWTLPFGALTLILTLNITFMSILNDTEVLIPAAMVTGFVSDVFLKALKPSARHLLTLRIFAFVVPCTFFVLYFFTLMLLWNNWWSLHVWMGSVVLSGLSSVLLSYVAVPSPIMLDHAEG